MNLLAKRIEGLQKNIKIYETGVFDLNTTNAFLNILEIRVDDRADHFERKKALQKYLGFRGNKVDGIFGSNSLSRLEMLFSRDLPKIPLGASLIVSLKSLELIIEFEVSSKATYERRFKNPVLPGVNSGITIGIGYDLGHVSLDTFSKDWRDFLSPNDFTTLSKVVGKTREEARRAFTSEVKGVVVEWDQAVEVFSSTSMPSWATRTLRVYPGLEKLPPDAQGAIVSIVYNRGASVSNDDRRREMRNLVQLIADQNLSGMANEIRSMKRLWPGVRGLQIRRNKEADLVENATYVIKPVDYVFI